VFDVLGRFLHTVWWQYTGNHGQWGIFGVIVSGLKQFNVVCVLGDNLHSVGKPTLVVVVVQGGSVDV
jgi:hypothetical protein